jgi:hypothetical protein
VGSVFNSLHPSLWKMTWQQKILRPYRFASVVNREMKKVMKWMEWKGKWNRLRREW